MNPQEQEEIDYQMGTASDLQNAFTLSRLTRKPDDSDKINAAIAAGKHVVVCETTAYCRTTDAIMGSDRWFVASYDERERAEADIQGLTSDIYDADLDYYVLPRLQTPPPPPPASTSTNDDELPF